MEKKERVGVGWQGCRESESLFFPRERLFVRGLYQSQLQKGKCNLKGGGKKWRDGMEWEFKSEKSGYGSTVVDVLVINKKVQS